MTTQIIYKFQTILTKFSASDLHNTPKDKKTKLQIQIILYIECFSTDEALQDFQINH